MTDTIEWLDCNDMLATGITYRQLDYWIRQGYVRARQDRPGTGYARSFHLQEREIVRLMLRLIDAGFTVEVAAKTARVGAESGQEACLAPGIVLSWWECADENLTAAAAARTQKI